MIKLADFQTWKTFPAEMRTPERIALAYAYDRQKKKFIEHMKRVYIWADLDLVDDKKLDFLAVENRVLFYDATLAPDIKRNLIRNYIYWYMKSGTRQAMEEMIDIVFDSQNTSVEEWYRYDGKPYRFKVKTDAQLTESRVSFFIDMLPQIKNARSRIDAIEIPRRLDQTIYAGAAAESTSQPAAIMGGYSVSRKATGNLQAGVAVRSTSTPEPITDGYHIDRDATADLWTGAATGSTATPEPVIDVYIDRKEQAVIWPAMALNGIYTNLVKEGDHATTF